jgi:preprotein translocase subunit SecF
VQRTGDNQFLLQTSEIEGSATTPAVGPALPSERERIELALSKEHGGFLDTQGNPTTQFTEFSSVSAAVSKQIGRNAAIAVLMASVAITLYITWSFRNVPNSARFGVSAIVALLHDVLLVVGVFSILGKVFDIEVNTFFITGLLTVVGFSVHDSIVVFDRIRENVGRGLIRNFPDAVNHSLLQTMGRSFNTSLTLIFSILALLLLGGGSIRDFLLVLLIGVTTGTYSSVFIASMFLVTWQQGDIPRAWRRLIGRETAPRPAEAAVE